MRRMLLLISILPFIAFLHGCDDVCSYDTINNLKSPNKLFYIKLSKKNCGATTGYVYEYTISDGSNEKLMLRFDDNHESIWAEKDSDISDVEWIDNNAIIKFNYKIRIYDENTSYKKFNVIYKYIDGTNYL